MNLLHRETSRKTIEFLMPFLATLIVTVLAYYAAHSFEMWQCSQGTRCPPDDYFAKCVAFACGAATMLITSILALGINVTFRADSIATGRMDDTQDLDGYQPPITNERELDDTWTRFSNKHQEVEPIARPGNVFIDLGGRLVPLRVTSAQLLALAQELQHKTNITYAQAGAGRPFSRGQMDSLRHDLIKKGLADLTRAGECVLHEDARVGIIQKAASPTPVR